MSEITVPSEAKPDLLRFIKAHIRDYALLLSLLAIMVFFQFTTNGTLFMPVNMTNIILQNSYIVIMAVGMLLVIVSGHIDLSVGSVMGFVGAVAAVMIVQWQMNFVLAAILCLAVGAAIGAAQGYWIAYHRIPSFIVTLAGMLVFKGLTLWLLEGKSVGPFPPTFQLISSGFVPDFLGSGKPNVLSLVAGVALAVLIVLLAVRARRREQARGIVEEPFGFFAAKHTAIFLALIYMSWLMASFRGLPNVFIVMAIGDQAVGALTDAVNDLVEEIP